MQVHICTFQIKLTTVTVSPYLKIGRQSLESVWKSDKGQIIVVGAVRSNIKNGKATFNEIFEIKTDLTRDPDGEGYLPGSLILQIRTAGQALNARISNSICALSLNDMLNTQETTVIALQSEDNMFTNNLEVKCLEVVKTGMKKSHKKLQRRVSKQKPLQNGGHEYSKPLERSSSLISKNRKNDSPSKQNDEQMKEQHQKLKLQITILKQQLLSEKASHVVTSDELKNAQLQLSEQEHVINQISALISQRETNIIQLNQKIQKIIDQNSQLNELNNKLKNVVQQSKTIEFKNTELQGYIAERQRYIVERERQIEELKTKLGQVSQKETQVRSHVGKEKQINIFLSKSIDQFKKDLSRKQQQVTSLAKIKISLQNEKEKLTNELKSLKENSIKNQQQLKSDFVESAIKFNQLYEKYSKLKESSVQTSGMVNRAQLQEMQKNYELKLKQYQERETIFKDNVQNIEKEMVQLQQLLQEKEENQIKLIDFSRKLQLEVDRLEAQKKFWNRIHQNEQEQQKQCQEDGQIAQLKKKVRKLLLILRQNSDSFLQSQRNKQEIILIQKENKQINHRLSLFRDESKQVKEKFLVLLKENKKLIQRVNKTQKENENLFKNNQKLSHDLNLKIQKEKTTNGQYQILNYRMVWLEKELTQLKSISNEQRSLQYVDIQMDKHISCEMGEIKQMSEEIISSRNYSRKDFEQNKDEVKQFNTEIIQELTSLLKQRVNLNQNFCKTIEGKVRNQNPKQNYEEVERQLTQLTKLTTQLKRRLIQKGEREFTVSFEKQIRKITEQINKLQIQR